MIKPKDNGELMKKKIVLILIGSIFMGCADFGYRPNKTEKERFIQSKNFNSEKGTFVNRRQNVIDEMKKRTFNLKLFKEYFSKGVDRVPVEKLPEVKPSIAEFLKDSQELKVIWFGHSSFLLNMDGITILVDPVFSENAAPVSFLVKRFQKPVLELSELPGIDYIVISHDHYDHLDRKSIQFFKNKDTKFITPLGVGSHLKGWGIPTQRIYEKDWWEEEEFSGVKFIATPAQHFSGRTGIHDNETLWASWVIKSKNHNIYFSGDSGYDIHFKEIGEKLGPFDVAFIESGQYNEKWKEVHMLPVEAAKAFKDLKARKYFPVHWGMFELALHPWYEPVEKIFNLIQSPNGNIIVPKIGEIVPLKAKFENTYWWRKD